MNKPKIIRKPHKLYDKHAKDYNVKQYSIELMEGVDIQ